MPDTSGTTPDTEKGGENARWGRTNNYYHKQERPRNNIGGLEELTLIKRSRTPALDLKRVREALQNKIRCDQKDGYVAATLLSEAESQTGSVVGQSQQSGGPTRPTQPTMPDHTSDNFVINGTFNSLAYEAAVLRFQNKSVLFWNEHEEMGGECFGHFEAHQKQRPCNGGNAHGITEQRL